MENLGLYQDIAKRTEGDIYVGVVGPVRTGKSTFIKKFMDTKPEINADTVPMISGSVAISRATEPRARSIPSKIAEPIIIGMESRKEKLAASVLSTPCRRRAEIVAPLRDTPGSTAIPCKTPVKMLFLPFKRAVSDFLNISLAVSRHAVSTNPKPNSCPDISPGARYLNISASATVGTQASNM